MRKAMDRINPDKAAEYIVQELEQYPAVKDKSALIHSAVRFVFEYPGEFSGPTYSQETIEHAKHDMHRFGWAARDESGEMYLYERKTKIKDELWDCDSNALEIPQNQYPEVQPGQCVALADIVGGGKNGTTG